MKKSRVWVTKHVALILVSQLAFGCGQQNPEELIHSGREFLHKKDYPAAVIQLKNAVRLRPITARRDTCLAWRCEEAEICVRRRLSFEKQRPSEYSSDLVYPALVRVLLAEGQLRKGSRRMPHTRSQQHRPRLSCARCLGRRNSGWER